MDLHHHSKSGWCGSPWSNQNRGQHLQQHKSTPASTWC